MTPAVASALPREVDLAERAGLHWTYVGGIERGERTVLDNVNRLARVLRVPLADLFTPFQRSVAAARRHRAGRRDR